MPHAQRVGRAYAGVTERRYVGQTWRGREVPWGICRRSRKLMNSGGY